jgi:peptidoglycan/xylan/chitin deacetylase (PgdA/CDA1 family)
MSIKRRAKVAISLFWYAGSVLARLMARLTLRTPRGRLVVLYYHAVPADARAAFARQLDALGRRVRVVRAGELDGLRPGEHGIAITFDDAFQSVGAHAVPELVRRSLPSTVFVPVRLLGRCADWDSRDDAGLREQVMTAEELRALPELVELGSHSSTHRRLPALDAADLAEEIAGSRRELEGIVGAPVRYFAFPYGAHDRRVVQACRDAGYERSFSIVPRHAVGRRDDYVVGRVAVDPGDGRLEFFLKARGAYAWMTHVSAVKAAFARAR